MPTYSQNHLLLRFGGEAAQGQETWSCGVRLIQNGVTDPEALLAFAESALDAMVEACEDYVSTPSAAFSPLVRLQQVDLNPIGTNGKYLFPNSPVGYTYPDTGIPGAATNAAPLQVAYCVTLRSSLYRRGPAARGRYYVPCGDVGVTSTGVMGTGAATTYANAAGTFLEAIQVVGTEPSEAARVRLLGDGAGGPRISPVGSVEVGNVYDTQRRRRRQIEETYIVSTTWTEPSP